MSLAGGTIARMAEATAADQRALLTAERERVTNELTAMGVDRETYDDGFADSGQVTAERGEVEALVGTLRDTLNEIDAALAKFDNGTYGRCEECGGPISDARLEAKPAARTCIDCAPKRR